MIRRLLVEDATDSGLLVAVSDAAGRLLWVEGDSRPRARAEGMNFAAGAYWSEAYAGTNAPGTALVLDRAVQIFGAEHLARSVTPWSCAAAPIHDPDTRAVLGALDITGGDEVASPYALSLVRAAVAAVESELRVLSLTRTPRPSSLTVPPAVARLEVLGRHAGLLRHRDGETRLSLRHSELLVLLATHPEGLTADELAVSLHEHESAAVTVRAEMSRLRSVLRDVPLASRPYRLIDRVSSDALEVRDHVLAGRLEAAMQIYRGPLLPQSEAPGVVQLREAVHAQLRAGLLASGNPDALLRFADTDHSRLDLEVWQAALHALPAGSSRQGAIRARVALVLAELAPQRGATFVQPARS